MKPDRPCPICRGLLVDTLHEQRFILPAGHPLAAGYDVVACVNCGFVYADTSVTQAEYDKFYSEHSKYEDAKTGTGGVENPYDWKRQQETAAQIVDMLPSLAARILDVGCANGGMLKALQELGCQNLCGIDPSPVCVNNTRNLGIEAHQGSLFLPFEDHAYDCLILSHTLEHVQDLHGASAWMKKRLKPGGIVYIETPSAGRYKDFLYAPFQDFNTEHINHFSLLCLKNLMNLNDFQFLSGAEKKLTTGADMYYPAVFGFWKLSSDHQKTDIQKDAELRNYLEEYIHESQKIMRDIDKRIFERLTGSPSVVVWGVGQLTMKLLVETSLATADILAFVDNNPINHGKLILGRPILLPRELQDWNAPILVATLLHHHSIAEQIRGMGLKNEIIFLTGEHE